MRPFVSLPLLPSAVGSSVDISVPVSEDIVLLASGYSWFLCRPGQLASGDVALDVCVAVVDVPVDIDLAASSSVGRCTRGRPVAVPVPGTVSGSVTRPSSIVRIGAVHSRSPPAAISTSSPDGDAEWTTAEAESKTPSIPWIVSHMETVCDGPRIIRSTPPRRIPPSSSIYDRRAIDIASHISGVIPHIHHFRSRVVHIDILHIVVRTARGDGVDLVGNVHTNCPRAGRIFL